MKLLGLLNLWPPFDYTVLQEAVPNYADVEYCLPVGRAHAALPDGKAHYSMPHDRLHYTANQE